MKKIRVLIVEDSKVIREFLEYIVGSDPRLGVAASVESAEEALRILDYISPDVISMDIRLPGMSGFEATQRIMSQSPTPIVVVSASVDSAELEISMNALQAGALAVLEKPVGTNSAQYAAMAGHLCTQLVIMSQVKVVRRYGAVKAAARSERRPVPHPGGYQMLGIVSSTGGPGALAQVLSRLGPEFPFPIALVQHITSSFLEGFASWLESTCPFSVVIVKDRVVPVPGTVYLATRDRHLIATTEGLRVTASAPVCGQRPSGTVLLESMADAYGGRALGVILTGMGDDGAAGMLQLYKRGGHTIAEDESTAVIYGMPAEAVRLGGVSESLPLPAIGPRIVELACSRRVAA